MYNDFPPQIIRNNKQGNLSTSLVYKCQTFIYHVETTHISFHRTTLVIIVPILIFFTSQSPGLFRQQQAEKIGLLPRSPLNTIILDDMFQEEINLTEGIKLTE